MSATMTTGDHIDLHASYYDGMSWRDLVRGYWPDASDVECDRWLWNHTGYPFAAPDEVDAQLMDAARRFSRPTCPFAPAALIGGR